MTLPVVRSHWAVPSLSLVLGSSALLSSCLLSYDDWPDRREAFAGTSGLGTPILATAGNASTGGRGAVPASSVPSGGNPPNTVFNPSTAGSFEISGGATGMTASLLNGGNTALSTWTGVTGGARSSASSTAGTRSTAGGATAFGGTSLRGGAAGMSTVPATGGSVGTKTTGGVATGGNTSTGSKTTATTNAGGTIAGGASSGGVGGTNAGGTSFGANSNGGTITGGTSAGGAVWLNLSANRARATDPPNAALGIDGLFYAYSDGCASVSFDPATRCASGNLCDAGPSWENWGVAIGFDFRNTGSTGVPPNAKQTWDPRSVGATGVTWAVSGISVAQLELWILDMDPIWGGTCTAITCEIDGPPDGRAGLTATGELYFNAMFKDDWGGAGTKYVYDPALTQTLQFKIAAIKVGAGPFEFCIDALGLMIP